MSGWRRTMAAVMLVGLLALGLPASARASVRIQSDSVYAQADVIGGSPWAEVIGEVTFSTGRVLDAVVTLTVAPQRPCPARPPAGVQTNPGPGFDAESSPPILADGDTVVFQLTPRRREVSGHATRLCAYLLRNGVVRARGSRRLDVALAAVAGSSHSTTGETVVGILGTLLIVVVFALVIRRAWKLLFLPRTGGSEVGGVLERTGFSNHALEQFADRAGIPLTRYRDIELTVRDLLIREGMVRTDRPSWSRSSNTAELYLQAGEWMLFILETDRRTAGRYTCVTAVNGSESNTWENALRRGYIHTRAPAV